MFFPEFAARLSGFSPEAAKTVTSADKGKLAEVTHLTMRHLTLAPAIPGGDGAAHRIPIQPPEKCIRVGASILTESADVGMLPQI